MNWLLDIVPVELWVALAAVALVVTWQIWWPVFMALPRWLKVTIIGAAALAAAYHKGRNTGAKGAVQREGRERKKPDRNLSKMRGLLVSASVSVMLAGCVTTQTPIAGTKYVPCEALQATTYSRHDTQETQKQVREENAVKTELCGAALGR